MKPNNHNVQIVIKKLLNPGKTQAPVDLRQVYHEYPKRASSEPRHMFSAEFPAICVEEVEGELVPC